MLPAHVTFPDASLVEPLACVVKSLRRGGVAAGDRCYVIGLGVMGLLHVLAARALGAEVFGSDFIAERREIATRNGAHAFHPDETAAALPDGADVVICGPGTSGAMRAALAAVAPGGTAVMFTPFAPETRARRRSGAVLFRRLAAGRELLVRSRRHARRAGADRAAAPSPRRKSGPRSSALDDVPRAYRDLAESRIVKPIVTFE